MQKMPHNISTSHSSPDMVNSLESLLKDKTSAWRPIPLNIHNIICKRFLRKVNNDNTVSVNGQIIQLLPTKTRRHFVKASVYINLWLDSSWHVFHPDYGEIPCEPITGMRQTGVITSLMAGERSESIPRG